MDPTTYFGDRAEDYERWRPGYPRAAVDLALGGLEAPVRVIDLGSGTGIAARAFAAAGCEVTGVEPDPVMRARAAAHPAPAGGPPPRYVAGRAEETGLAAGSAALVVAAQAFHWFDFAAATREMHRVLRRGGRLALLWNLRSEREPFMAEYAAVVRAAQDAAEAGGRRVSRSRSASPDESPWFAQVRRHSCENAEELSFAGVVGRISSASYFPRPVAGPEGELRRALLARLEEAFDAYAEDGRARFVQTTELTLAEATAQR
ncbi:MAG: class I SAM-dependent methyltransferase [Planctomycetota bacterium]